MAAHSSSLGPNRQGYKRRRDRQLPCAHDPQLEGLELDSPVQTVPYKPTPSRAHSKTNSNLSNFPNPDTSTNRNVYSEFDITSNYRTIQTSYQQTEDGGRR